MSFPYDVRYYFRIYNNFFDEEFCKKAVSSLENIKWDKHQYYTPDKTYVSHDDDLQVSYDKFAEGEIINNCIKDILSMYLFNDMPPEFSWFKSFNEYSSVRFNRYDQNSLMRPHCDHIHDLFDGNSKGVPILSILGTLNNDYEGGDFIMWGDQKIEIPAGSIVVFPSNFMYPHCVTKITKGTRYSFVSWAW